MPKTPVKSIWQNETPGQFKSLTRWLSKPGTQRGRITNLLRWRFRGQWKVGEDHMQNEYYLYQPFPETPIRRFCIFKHGQTDMDNIPFLWYQWIRYQRNYPPTIQELEEYDAYLADTQRKAAAIKQRDDLLRKENPKFYDEQKKNLEEQQSELTNKAQREVIALFASRENALRIASENKVAKMKEADDIIESERRRYEEMQFQKTKDLYSDPLSVEPKQVQEIASDGEQQETFRPGAWRPWQDDDNEDDNDVHQSSK